MLLSSKMRENEIFCLKNLENTISEKMNYLQIHKF